MKISLAVLGLFVAVFCSQQSSTLALSWSPCFPLPRYFCKYVGILPGDSNGAVTQPGASGATGTGASETTASGAPVAGTGDTGATTAGTGDTGATTGVSVTADPAATAATATPAAAP